MAMHKREEGNELMLDFDKQNGLIPVVVQHAQTKEVLMVAFVNKAAFEATLATGKATFFSRTRNVIWVKGETSGDYLQIKEIRIDCDQDALIYLVQPLGAGVCHTKNAAGQTRMSCFYRKINQNGQIEFIKELQ